MHTVREGVQEVRGKKQTVWEVGYWLNTKFSQFGQTWEENVWYEIRWFNYLHEADAYASYLNGGAKP